MQNSYRGRRSARMRMIFTSRCSSVIVRCAPPSTRLSHGITTFVAPHACHLYGGNRKADSVVPDEAFTGHPIYVAIVYGCLVSAIIECPIKVFGQERTPHPHLHTHPEVRPTNEMRSIWYYCSRSAFLALVGLHSLSIAWSGDE